MAEIDKQSAGPGKLLAAARSKAGLSIVDIAQRLNLSIELIGQLESDQYNCDLHDTFIRGYLRTYARSLEQDEERIVALYSQAVGNSIVRNYYTPSADVAPVKGQLGNHLLGFKVISISIVIAILVLGWIAYNPTDVDNKTAEQLIVQPDTAEATIDQQSIVPPSTDETDQQDVAVTIAEPLAEIIESPILTNAELEFNFIEDCWVQVIDSNEEVLAVGLKSAGRRFVVSGVPPITVVLGKPRAISLQYNNQAVDLSIYPASQAARFILGEEY